MTVLVLTTTSVETNPRVQRQLRSIPSGFKVITAGLGPSSSQNDHYDLSITRRIHIGRINILELPRILAFGIAMLLGIRPLADRLFSMTWGALPAWRIVRRLKSLKPNFIFAHDVQTAWIASRISSASFIWIDLPELASYQNETSFKWRLLWMRQLKHQTFLARNIGDIFTTVSPGLQTIFLDKFGIWAELLMNTVTYDPGFGSSEPSRNTSTIRLVHQGAAIASRGLEVMIDAVKDLPDVTLDLFLTKLSSEYLLQLQNYVRSISNVRILEPVPRGILIETISKYDAVVIFVQPRNRNQEFCLPNKFFEAIQARVAVISGPTPDIYHLIDKFSIGFVTTGWSSKHLRATLQSLTHESLLEKQPNLNKAALALAENDIEFIQQKVLQKSNSR
jgi:hypothetical protein